MAKQEIICREKAFDCRIMKHQKGGITLEEIKLLHTADVHIDWLFDNFSPQTKFIRRKEIIKSLDIIADIAIQQQVTAVLIAGDLFHAPRVDRSSLAAVIASFNRLAAEGIKVLLLPGNHDPLVDGSIYDYADFGGNFFVFREKNWSVYEGIPNLKIYGFPYFAEFKERNVLNEIRVDNSSSFNVAMLHGSYKQLKQAEDYMPFGEEDIINSDFDYIALGHYHNFKDCSQGKVKCFYPGSPNALTFKNFSERQVVITTLSDTGTKVQPIPIPGRKYALLDFDMTLGTPEELMAKIKTLADSTACLKVTLNGLADKTKILDLNQIRQLFEDSFFYLEIVDRTVIVSEETGIHNSIKGIFISKMQALLNTNEAADEDTEIVQNALRLGLQALERGRRS